MAKLTDPVREFIVRRLAWFVEPAEIVRELSADFGIKTDTRQVQEYDPATVHGRAVGKKWKQLFETERAQLMEAKASVPGSVRTVRLSELWNLYLRARRAGNIGQAADLLKQMAQEQGGVFTNRHEVTGKDGAPLESLVRYDFEHLRHLPADELVRIHSETLGIPGKDRR